MQGLARAYLQSQLAQAQRTVTLARASLAHVQTIALVGPEELQFYAQELHEAEQVVEVLTYLQTVVR